MFDKELFKISEEAVDSINKEDFQKKNQKMEKKVLGIIKKHSYTSMNDENGMVYITAASNNDNHEYSVLKSIITSGRQKYFEEEYSLYFFDEEYIEAYSECFNMITFFWNSFEYNMRNKPKGKNRG